MLVLCLDILLFISGFIVVMAATAGYLWQHWISAANLPQLLVVLPILVWGTALAYYRTYAALTSISREQLGWLAAWARVTWHATRLETQHVLFSHEPQIAV